MEEHRNETMGRSGNRWFGRVVLAVGLLALGYCLYDLMYPGHFVGDMYGLEVMGRLMLLAGPAVALLLSGVVLHFAWKREGRAPRVGAGVVLLVSALVLVATAWHVAGSRRQDAIRAQYPTRGTDELLRIARDQKDSFAVEELLIRKDPAAVPGLCAILLDDDENVTLRGSAAHALGEIGGDEAKAALERARSGSPPEVLKIAIDYALEVRITPQTSDE